MTFSVSVSDALAMLSDRTVRERYWEPDECATQCRLCKSTFTFLNRRHHCRRCLRVFCGDCTSSKNRLVLYGYQNERVRVCDKCYEEARLENEFHVRYAEANDALVARWPLTPLEPDAGDAHVASHERRCFSKALERPPQADKPDTEL